MQLRLACTLILAAILGSENALSFLFSGNGCQVHVLLDSLPISKGNEDRQERILKVLNVLYGRKGEYEVDTVLKDPRRIIPLAGTLKAKGANDVEEGRVHRLTWIAGAPSPKGLTDEQVDHLLASLEAKLTPEQKLELDPPKVLPSSTKRGTGQQKDFFEVAKKIPMADVVVGLGWGDIHCPDPKCDKREGVAIIKSKEDGTTDLLKCQHASCGSWAGDGVRLVAYVLTGSKVLKGNKDGAKQVIAWYRQHFQGQVPAEKSKAELAEEKLARRAERATARSAAILKIDEPEDVVATPDDIIYAQHDLGNAKRFIAQHNDRLRYCTAFRCWMAWDEKRFLQDDRENVLVKQLAHQTVERLEEEVLRAESDEAKLEAAKHAKISGQSGRIDGMLKQAQGIAGVNVFPQKLDANLWILNTPSGVVNLKTMRLRPHDRTELCTKITGVEFPEEDLPTPMFDKWFETVQPDDEKRDYLLRYTGYGLTGVVYQHLFVINVGEGRNGKGVWQEIHLKILGDYAAIVNPKLFIQGKHTQSDQNEKYKAALFGRRMVFASETENTVLLNTTEVNSITGGDPVKAKFLYRDEVTFNPTHKLQLATNHKPTITDTTEATWRRVTLITWDYTVPEGQGIEGLADKIIQAEGPGILRKMVKACLRWQQEGMRKPQAIVDSTQSYRHEEDRLGQFTDMCLTVGPNEQIGADTLYETYVTWAEGCGFKPTSNQKFWKAFSSRSGISKGRDENDCSVYIGVGKKISANDSDRNPRNDISEEELEEIIAESRSDPEGPEALPGIFSTQDEQLLVAQPTNKNRLSYGKSPGSPSDASGKEVIHGSAFQAQGYSSSVTVLLKTEDARMFLVILKRDDPTLPTQLLLMGFDRVPEHAEVVQLVGETDQSRLLGSIAFAHFIRLSGQLGNLVYRVCIEHCRTQHDQTQSLQHRQHGKIFFLREKNRVEQIDLLTHSAFFS